jgi:predicted transcriptional regulator
MYQNSGLPDFVFENKLSQKENAVLQIVLQNWPISALEIAEHLREAPFSREQRKKLSTKYSYYLKKLVEKKLVLSKRVGNALVVWPLRVEKYRAIETILQEAP